MRDMLLLPLAAFAYALIEVLGMTWARRIFNFLLFIPFFAGAWCFGWVAGWFWQVSFFSPTLCGWICAAGLTLFTAFDWVKDWRRG